MATQTLSPGSGVAQQYNPSTGTWSNFTPTLSGGADTSSVPSPYILSSPSSNVAAGTSGSGTAAAGDALNSSLNSSFDTSETASDITAAYQAQLAANTAGASTAANQITDEGQSGIAYEEGQAQNTVNQATGNSKGGIINPGAFGVIQDQSNQQVKLLTQQMNDALANNQASLVTASANALATETTNMSNARAAFLSNYFSTQQEARSEASFQTPEQAQVLTLSGQYPNAGITPTDTLAQAEAKISGSAQYKLTQTLTQSQVNAQNAQAAQATQTAAYQKLVNGFLSGDNSGLISYFQNQLELNQSNPSTGMTAAQVQTALSGIGGGAGSNLWPQVVAGTSGYSEAGATLGNTAATTNTTSLSSGGIGAAETGVTNFLSGFLGQGFGNNSSTPTPSLTTGAYPSGTNGAAYGYPGYVSNGISWVKSQ